METGKYTVDAFREQFRSETKIDEQKVYEMLTHNDSEQEYLNDIESKILVKKISLIEKITDPDIKKDVMFKMDVAGTELIQQTKQLINITKKRIAEEVVKKKREEFISKFDSKQRDYLRGLLGSSTAESDWIEIASSIDKNGDKTMIDGLLQRAKIVFAAEKPELMTYERYEAYLKLNENNLSLMTPDEFLERGFLNLPERAEFAMTGTEFLRNVLGVDPEEVDKKDGQILGKLSPLERQNAIVAQIEMGNIPSFLRKPVPIKIKDDQGNEIVTFAMPDVIAIGSDTDFIRVPISPTIAQALASYYGLVLPTKTMVQATYEEAGRSGKQVVAVKYDPFDISKKTTYKNSAYMDSAGFYYMHNKAIQNQLEGVEPGTLVSGGKKEGTVGTYVAAEGVNSIGFYGFFNQQHLPYQTEPGHGGESGFNHTEYALGQRFYAGYGIVNGKPRTMASIYADKGLAPIINRREYRRDKDQKLEPSNNRVHSEGPFDVAKAYPFEINKKPRVPGLRKPLGPIV